MVIGIIEGAIALILTHFYKDILTSSKTSTICFFMKFAQLKSECFGTFSEGFKSGSSLYSSLNTLYHSAL